MAAFLQMVSRGVSNLSVHTTFQKMDMLCCHVISKAAENRNLNWLINFQKYLQLYMALWLLCGIIAVTRCRRVYTQSDAFQC